MKTKASKTLSALIVDDEALARRGLKLHLAPLDGIEIAGEAVNGRQAVELIRSQAPDLVFLDIQMPGMTGFDVIRELHTESLPVVIFVTAHDELIIEVFEAHAVHYLLKPIDGQQLANALQKVRDQLATPADPVAAGVVAQAAR